MQIHIPSDIVSLSEVPLYAQELYKSSCRLHSTALLLLFITKKEHANIQGGKAGGREITASRALKPPLSPHRDDSVTSKATSTSATKLLTFAI